MAERVGYLAGWTWRVSLHAESGTSKKICHPDQKRNKSTEREFPVAQWQTLYIHCQGCEGSTLVRKLRPPSTSQGAWQKNKTKQKKAQRNRRDSASATEFHHLVLSSPSSPWKGVSRGRKGRVRESYCHLWDTFIWGCWSLAPFYRYNQTVLFDWFSQTTYEAQELQQFVCMMEGRTCSRGNLKQFPAEGIKLLCLITILPLRCTPVQSLAQYKWTRKWKFLSP